MTWDGAGLGSVTLGYIELDYVRLAYAHMNTNGIVLHIAQLSKHIVYIAECRHKY
jgi:hypothetical protein